VAKAIRRLPVKTLVSPFLAGKGFFYAGFVKPGLEIIGARLYYNISECKFNYANITVY
jgi:hypothetical protein